MQPFRKHRGVAVPLDLPDVDTDQIIPKQYLRLSRIHISEPTRPFYSSCAVFCRKNIFSSNT